VISEPTADDRLPRPEEELASTQVADLRDTPMSKLVGDETAFAGAAIDRVLDLEASGLLTVASFNASI
jgi:hypothetical protein